MPLVTSRRLRAMLDDVRKLLQAYSVWARCDDDIQYTFHQGRLLGWLEVLRTLCVSPKCAFANSVFGVTTRLPQGSDERATKVAHRCRPLALSFVVVIWITHMCMRKRKHAYECLSAGSYMRINDHPRANRRRRLQNGAASASGDHPPAKRNAHPTFTI